MSNYALTRSNVKIIDVDCGTSNYLFHKLICLKGSGLSGIKENTGLAQVFFHNGLTKFVTSNKTLHFGII